MQRLDRDFFDRPTLKVAQDLLGCEFVFGECSGIITEVEAYVGQDDLACHATSGKTERNKIMWGEPGYAYVYFTYGMHHCLNFVTEKKGFPAAVLLRSIIPTRGIELMRARREKGSRFKKVLRKNPLLDKDLTNGPSKVCEAFGINLDQNDLDLCDLQSEMFVRETGLKIDFEATSRIGIREGLDKKWRFVVNKKLEI